MNDETESKPKNSNPRTLEQRIESLERSELAESFPALKKVPRLFEPVVVPLRCVRDFQTQRAN